jgi:hypothetical protein
MHMDDDPVCELHDDGEDIFVLVDGVKIARRGRPDTAQAMTWVMLEPGWTVRDVQSGNAIEVRYEGARICGRDGVIAFAACLGERSTAVSDSAKGSRAWAGAEAVSRCDKLSTGALLVPAR